MRRVFFFFRKSVWLWVFKMLFPFMCFLGNLFFVFFGEIRFLGAILISFSPDYEVSSSRVKNGFIHFSISQLWKQSARVFLDFFPLKIVYATSNDAPYFSWALTFVFFFAFFLLF